MMLGTPKFHQMDGNIERLTPRIRDACRYPRLKSGSGTVLMIDAGYFIQRECADGFEQNDWQVIPLRLKPLNTFIERFLMTVVVNKPDILFTVNHLGFDTAGVLTRMLEEMEMPFISWFVDSPEFILLDHKLNSSSMAVVPVWERSYLTFLKRFGFNNCFHLPLASNPKVFKKNYKTINYKYKTTFVGDSMVNSSAKWRKRCGMHPSMNSGIDNAALELMQSRSLDASTIISKHYSDAARALGKPKSKFHELTFFSAAVLEATRRQREIMVHEIKKFDLHVFGDTKWTRVIDDKVKHHNSVNYYTELSNVYMQSTVNLNLTSYQMKTAVNQRVFDAPLAGGFLVTDDQEDMNILFDTTRETALYQEISELPSMVKYYLKNNHQRTNIVERARERILAEHTYVNRIRVMLENVRQLFYPKSVTKSLKLA